MKRSETMETEEERPLEENSCLDQPEVTQIQNISMKEVTDLMSQGESVSFVIVGEGQDALEWIQQASVVVDNQTSCENEETSRIVVMDLSEAGHSVLETSAVKVNTEEIESSSRKRARSPTPQVASKLMKLSTSETGDSVHFKIEEEVPREHDLCKLTKHESSDHESVDRSIQIAKSIKRENVISVKESQKVKVTQGLDGTNYSPVITIYASSNASSTSAAGSTANLVPLSQEITVVTESVGADSVSISPSAQTVTESLTENQVVQISSPGANVELAANNVVPSVQEGNKARRVSRLETGGFVGSGMLDEEMVYRCTECDYASANKHYYKQHVDLVHNTARPFKCPFCDYAGKRGHALREHLIVHSAQRPYSCMHCNATFRKKGHLTNHTKLHATVIPVEMAAGQSQGQGSQLLKFKATAQSQGSTLVKVPVSVSATGGGLAIPSGASLPAVTVTPAVKKQLDPSMAVKRSDLWCALCNKEMSDTTAFQIHLQSVHKTDRLYACDSCQFVAASKAAVMDHLSTHISTPSPSVLTVPSPAPTAMATPLYACSQCGFTTPAMSSLVAHAATHAVKTSIKGSAVTVSAKTLPQTQQHQTSKVICSECGHMADNTEMMRAHMWTHISNAKEPKEKSSTQDSDAESTNSSAIKTAQGPSAAGLKPLPENAAFKCTECSFVSREASQFVKHMLVHKTQQNQAPKTQAQTGSADHGSSLSVVGGVAAGNKKGPAYTVKPVTTENTCQNNKSSPFIHDVSTGRFRCTICGYTCEYQRTIKAHIWKHSGHRHVDYPIFQNGPTSMYEDPVPASGSAAVSAATPQPDVAAAPQPARAPSPSTAGDTTAAPVSTSGTPSSTPSAAPLSVKFITVSGSRVLHSSGPLPPGNLKLIPVPPVSTPSTAVPSGTDRKSVVSSVALRSSALSAAGPTAEGVADAKGEEKAGEKREHVRLEVLRRDDAPSVHNENEASGKKQPKDASGITENSAGVLAAYRGDSFADHCAFDADSRGKIASDLPKDSSSTTVSVIQNLPTDSATTDSFKEDASLSIPSNDNPAMHEESAPDIKGGVLSPKSDKATVDKEGMSTSLDEPPLCIVETASTTMQDQDSRLQAETTEPAQAARKESSDSMEETSIASRVQSRRQCQAGGGEPSVVVEAIQSMPVHSTLTGLASQQNSPRVPRSSNSSPDTVSTEESPPTTDAEEKPGAGKEETVSRCLRSRKPKAPGSGSKDKAKDEAVSLTSNSGVSANTSAKPVKGGKSDEAKLTPKSQCLQDSESAVTLLSLLKKGPNINPACPPTSKEPVEMEAAHVEAPGSEDGNRSPTSSSETDSVAKGTATDMMSEDLASEMESTSSGKTRASGGGICSTLLAVIEQLRERSRSESDAEDRLVQPPAKKRGGRRRGRQGPCGDELLELDGSENVEQLFEEDCVSYRCKLCHYTSQRVPLIRLHMRTHRQKGPFECSLCPMVAESSEMLQEHMIQHCKVRTYACKFCPQSFNHKSTLRAHMRAHNDTDPFLCDLCDYETSSPLEYRAHMQKHAGSALLQCPHCPALLASRQDLRLHLAGNCLSALTAQGGQEGEGANRGGEGQREKVVCSQCAFSTADVWQMKEHVASHMGGQVTWGVGVEGVGEGPLRCALCDFTAVSSRSLKSHMKRHANDQRYVQQPLEQYKCALCGYVCHHLPSLKSHMWRHASHSSYTYHFTNDVINAAIDYDTHADPPPPPPAPQPAPSVSAGASSTPSTAGVSTALGKRELDEPELLDRVLSAEQRIVEGQMARAGGAKPVCWVTFRCCQCGFETINKAKLNLHMRTHADIISRTLKVNTSGVTEDEASAVDADAMKFKVVYGPM